MSDVPSVPHDEPSTGDVERAARPDLLPVLGSASLLIGVAVALAFPLLWPRAPRAVHALAACVAAALPFAALPLARLGSRATPRRRPTAVYHKGWLSPVLALGLALLAYGWHHPRLWVINFTAEPLRLWVDGQLEASLEPAGLDAARAAVELRLPRGEHQLSVRDAEDRVVASSLARLASGRDHLYAPASADRCFWLEVTGYGRDATHSLQPLVSASHFFALDADVDAWFTESPEPPSSDRRSSGGSLTALRQSLCARAPEAVRPAASALGP